MEALPRYSVQCDSIDSKTTDFGSASTYLYIQKEGELYLLLGYNKDHDNWCSFGGGAEPGETPKDTALRETDEETNGKICDIDVLETALYRSSTRKLIKTPPGRKPIYIFIIELLRSEINSNFAANYKTYVDLNLHSLPKERKENRELVMVPFSTLRKAYETYDPKKPLLLTASLAQGLHTCELRSVCVDTCRWLCHTTFPTEPLHYFSESE